MPLPPIEPFELFLSGTRLSETPPIDTPSVPFTMAGYGISEAPVLHLSYPESGVALESMLKKVCDQLEACQHVADRDVALATLGLIAETRDPSVSAVEHANRALCLTRSADFYLSVVLPTLPERGYEIPLGSFSLKAFDPKTILYWANRCGCAYPIDLEQLSDRVAFERERIQTKLIAWDELPGIEEMLRRWGHALGSQSIVDFYFHAVAGYFSRQAPVLVDDHLLVLEAGALVSIDSSRLLATPYCQHVGLFHWRGIHGHRGWALLSLMNGLHMNVMPAELFSTCVSWLDEEFGFRELSADGPLHPALAAYTRFLMRARRHARDGRRDEAFLHFVIALDLLLGLKGNATENVAKRAALLVHRQLGNTLALQVTRIKKLYGKRSDYVHKGEPAHEQDLVETEDICTEVLWSLLAASSNGDFRDIDSWLKQIDYLVSAIDADKVLTDTDFASVGIPFGGCRRTPPNKVLD